MKNMVLVLGQFAWSDLGTLKGRKIKDRGLM